MRKTQLIVLLLVAIMAVAIIPTAAVAVRQANPEPAVLKTPKVGGLTATLSAHCHPPEPKRYERYWVTGTLTSGSIVLQNRAIGIYWRYPDETSYHYWTTVYTNNEGSYVFSDNEGNQRSVTYKIVFAGDASYARDTEYLKVNNGRTTTSINIDPRNPGRYHQFAIEGFVRDGNGNPLNDKKVNITRQYIDATGHWTAKLPVATVYTGATGWYSFTFPTGTGWYNVFTVEYQAYPIARYSNYWSSLSSIVVDGR